MEIAGFTDVSVLMRCGVYLLLYKGEVVYVGQSTKLHARIGGHIGTKGKRPRQMLSPRALPTIRFDQVLAMPCMLSDLDRIETELIKKYLPKYNTEKKPKPPPMPLDLLLQMMPASYLPSNPEPRESAFRRR